MKIDELYANYCACEAEISHDEKDCQACRDANENRREAIAEDDENFRRNEDG